MLRLLFCPFNFWYCLFFDDARSLVTPLVSSNFSSILSVLYTVKPALRWYHTLQRDNSLKSVERFDHMMFVCRFQASR
jgi:hypothetical protein